MAQAANLEIVWRNPKPPQRRQHWEEIKQDSGTAHYFIIWSGNFIPLRRFVLDRYVELGNRFRWSSCLTRPRS